METQKTSRPIYKTWWFGCIVLAIVIGGTYYFTTYRHISCAKKLVKEQLKAPWSAKFTDIKTESKSWSSFVEVSGDYHSQNGFGAMTRGEFECSSPKPSSCMSAGYCSHID